MTERIGPDAIRGVADAALDVAGGDAVEVLVFHEWGGLTRFADSAIHQSTAREETAVRVRVVTGDRVGVATTNGFTEGGAAAAARSALEMAQVAAPDPMFPGLAPPAEIPPPAPFDEATAATSPAERAASVAALVEAAGTGLRVAGSCETKAMEVALANSEGHFAYAPATRANLTTVAVSGEGGSGFAEAAARRVADLDPGAVGARAGRKARGGARPRDLPPGSYEVVLEPAAVATLLGFLSYLGFGGRALHEERSCFSGREGERVVSELVSIWDDATAQDMLGLPFDFEGTPRRRVDLIRDGDFIAGVHDRRSAAQAGTESTGHALPPPNPEGPFPLNLVMRTGDASVEDMIRATGRGLLVTRFHYANIVHPTTATITGMTRDGTWAIEDGEILEPVKNLRFTESIIEALSAVEMVGAESELASEFFFEASRVPALRIGSFSFTGRSDH
jgi:PmbA protein